MDFSNAMEVFESYLHHMGDVSSVKYNTNLSEVAIKKLARRWGWDTYISLMQGEVYNSLKDKLVEEHKHLVVETVSYMRHLVNQGMELDPDSVAEITSSLKDLSTVLEKVTGAPNLRIETREQISDESLLALASVFEDLEEDELKELPG